MYHIKLERPGIAKPPAARIITDCKDCGSKRTSGYIDYEIKHMVNESLGRRIF
jgi:hypothetical protein